jgi:hypothetical protein
LIVGWSEAAAVARCLCGAVGLTSRRCAPDRYVDAADLSKALRQVAGDTRAARSRNRADIEGDVAGDRGGLFAMSCGSSLMLNCDADRAVATGAPPDAISFTGQFDSIVHPDARLQASTDFSPWSLSAHRTGRSVQRAVFDLDQGAELTRTGFPHCKSFQG